MAGPATSRSEHADAAAPVGRLEGVGPAVGRALRAEGLETLADLLWLLPSGYDDLRHPITVREAVARAGEADRHVVGGRVRSAGLVLVRGRRAARVVLDDGSGSPARIDCWWFFAARGIVATATRGRRLLAAGRVAPDRRGRADVAMMAHPTLLPCDTGERIRPRYARPKPAGISESRLGSLVRAALELVEVPPDPVPPRVAEREGFPEAGCLFHAVHQPEGEPWACARHLAERLAWAEAFSRVWHRTASLGSGIGRRAAPLPERAGVLDELQRALGFRWTPGQRAAIRDVSADLASDRPMTRLLLGDVGCGKTAVALAAAAQAAAAGGQVAIVAPTTILAEQYWAASEAVAECTGAAMGLLSASTPASERGRVVQALATGTIDVVVGTHALLGDAVTFARLALVIVDEQQRLGVAQRLALVAKDVDGRAPHLLTLSATPIPRTLALALRGELASSEIRDRPAGRLSVRTRIVCDREWDELLPAALRETADRGERGFVVCPRVEGDPEDGAGAKERFARLAVLLGRDRVVLAHGRMPPKALSEAVSAFRSGARPVLVGTTVVEVGIDVPEATLMIADDAGRFGMSQLHQLRGRVGRSDLASRCFLVHREPLDEPARARLEALVRHADGAAVAREDLRLRGAGDLDGTRQSGDAGLRFLEAFADRPWLERMEDDVREIRSDDPELTRPEHAGLRLFVARDADRLHVREEAG